MSLRNLKAVLRVLGVRDLGCHRDCCTRAFKRQLFGHSQNRNITSVNSMLREKLTQKLLLASYISLFLR